MTVNDLIWRLQQYPSDANVELAFERGDDVVACKLEVEGYSFDCVMKADCNM